MPATGLPIIALDAGAIGERLQGVVGATVLPMDATAANILAVLRDTAGPYTLAGEPLLRDAGESNQAAYLSQHHKAIAGHEKQELDLGEVTAQLLKLVSEHPALEHPARHGRIAESLIAVCQSNLTAASASDTKRTSA